MIYTILADEVQINGPVHALSIVAKTLQEFMDMDDTDEPSPACRGGDGSLPSKHTK